MSNLIILGSARKDSHTRTMVKQTFSDTPHDMIDLLDYKISTFDYGANYPESDEFENIVDKMLEAKNIIFASPIYWYTMSGVMKTFFDRFTDLTGAAKLKGRGLAGKRVFLFAVGADPEPPFGLEVPFERTAKYFDMRYVEGVYFCSRSENIEGILRAAQGFLSKIGS